MDLVSGFWHGALKWGRRVDVRSLGERAGGLGALESLSRGALIELGLPPNIASDWASTSALATQGTALTLADPRYPEEIAALTDAPPVLFVDGDPEVLSRPSVAVVGTRRCSPYGVGVARHLAGTVARAGQVVVSGLARGIDAHAHEATLGVGHTVAVLAHGLGTTAPPSNHRLRERIVEEGGAVVSHWPDDVTPLRWHFPVRNRWVAALAAHTVVVEAPARSGALITAREAAELGREVWVIPGPLGRANSQGGNRLAAQGAGLITDVDSWVAEHFGGGRDRAPWRSLLVSGASLDEVARARGLSVAEVMRELAMLELRGELVRLPGGRYGEGKRG